MFLLALFDRRNVVELSNEPKDRKKEKVKVLALNSRLSIDRFTYVYFSSSFFLEQLYRNLYNSHAFKRFFYSRFSYVRLIFLLNFAAITVSLFCEEIL